MAQFTITGRLVQGDPHKAQPPSRDPRTGAVKTDAAGQPIQQFFVAVAIAKNDANWPAIKATLDAEAKAAWPQFFGTPAANLQIGPELPAGCTNPKFANKIIDGDGFDEKGQPYSKKEGYAGHWVVKCASMFAPKVYEWTAQGWTETVYTGRVVKCGDYVSVAGNCVSNTSQQSPGMYMNLDAVTFEREGPAIVSAAAVDPNAAFGARGTPTTTPSGAVPTPAASPAPAPAPAATPAPPAAGTPPSPTAGAGSYTGYMETPAPPAPAAGPQLTAKGAGYTYEQMIANGWTDDTLRAQGYLA